MEYQAPRGNFVMKSLKDRLVDLTYDNPESRNLQSLEFHQEDFNIGGLGKLVDGKPDYESDIE